MATPRVLILRAPGTNCDEETEFAFEQAGARADRVHVNRLLAAPRAAADYQILCIPGGFSYGDDIAAGRILANQLRHHLYEALSEFKEAGKLILGICNGFQVLIKSGMLLPEDDQGLPPATLSWNDSGRFEDRWVRLRVVNDRCIFLQGIAALELPVAHAEGKFVVRDDQSLEQLQRQSQVALQYTSRSGDGQPAAYPDNPNGSMRAIAGICDTTGRVLGLMPHPERNIDPTHHPQWTRRPNQGPGDGAALFANAVAFFRL